MSPWYCNGGFTENNNSSFGIKEHLCCLPGQFGVLLKVLTTLLEVIDILSSIFTAHLLFERVQKCTITSILLESFSFELQPVVKTYD